MAPSMTAVSVALDWTPNTNHVGFFIAKAKGLYSAANLDVSLRSPHVDDYHVTPASLVASGDALLAVTPSESVISYNTWPDNSKPKLKAVAALLQHDTSAIVTLKSSGIDRPAKLDGAKYASYGARYEGRIVQQLIKNDGGKGEYVEDTSIGMLGLWETLLKGSADSTWVFMGWEGVEAEMKGVELNAFRLKDYNIPYGYAPVLVAHPDAVTEKSELLRSLLAATAEGYKFAAEHPEEAAKLFVQQVASEYSATPLPTPLDEAMVVKSLQTISKDLLTTDGRWGVMEGARWEQYLDWLSTSGLLTTKVQSRQPKDGVSTSLDGLRSGDVGEVIPRASISAKDLMVDLF